MTSWLGQYCINVADLEGAVAFYEALGLECASRTEIPQAYEAVMANASGGSRLQLAQQKDQQGPLDLGNAFWKLYVDTHDVDGLFARAVAAGATVVSPPERVDRRPVTVACLRDLDGYLVEVVQRHPWGEDVPEGDPWLGQYCINVVDLDIAVGFYERLGLTCTSRSDIGPAREAIVEHPGRGSKLQLAQQLEDPQPLRMGSMWKLYVYTDDVEHLHRVAVDAGRPSLMEPTRLDRWPVTVAFVTDPDGYEVELIQRHPT